MFHVLVYFPNNYNGGGSVRLKTGVWNSILVSHMEQRLTYSAALPGMSAGGRTAIEQLGVELTLTWDTGIAGNSLSYCATTLAPGARLLTYMSHFN